MATAVTLSERLPMVCGLLQGYVIESPAARVTTSDGKAIVSSP
jgi:hypothetical protein